jgi:Tfp pilus assembly protein PilP
MRRRLTLALLAVATLAVTALAVTGALAQEKGKKRPPEKKPAQGAQQAPKAPPADAQGVLTEPQQDLENIEEILEGEEDVLEGGGYSYDPGNRRDPFKSLLAAPDRPEFRGPRPEGIPGLLIDEIDLSGIFRTKRGYVAQVKAANQGKSYLLKEGDQLYDGDVVSINKNEVVFKQIVQDPTALKPFREVVKSLGR